MLNLYLFTFCLLKLLSDMNINIRSFFVNNNKSLIIHIELISHMNLINSIICNKKKIK